MGHILTGEFFVIFRRFFSKKFKKVLDNLKTGD